MEEIDTNINEYKESGIEYQTSDLKTNITSGKYLHFLVLAGIIILTLIVYSGTFNNAFTNWDDETLTSNKDIQNFSVQNIVKAFSNFNSNTYEPLMIITCSVIYKFFGLNPQGFHSVSLFFHLLNIVLVYIFVYQLLAISNQLPAVSKKSRIWGAALVACLFAIHPMHSESVYWISGIDGLQYSFFYLASLIFYLRYATNYTNLDELHKVNNLPKVFNYNYLLSLLFFILSLLSKSTAVTLPVILILLDYYVFRIKYQDTSIKTESIDDKLQSTEESHNIDASIKTIHKLHEFTRIKKYCLDKIPFFLFALAVGILAITSEKFIDTANNNIITQSSFLNRFFVMSYSVTFYIINLIAPVKLSAIHPSPELINGLLPLKYYLSPLFIILIIIAIIKIVHRPQSTDHSPQSTRNIIFGTLFFLFTISVALMAGKVRNSVVAERYTYLPYIGLFLIIGSQLSVISRQLFKIVVIVFILLFSFISYQRSTAWVNSMNLFNDVIEKYPESYVAFSLRGLTKNEFGDSQAAMQDFNRAIEINPQFADAYYNRGIVKNALDDKQGAINDYNKAIEINPQYVKVYNNRGNAKADIGDKEGALLDFNKAIEMKPQDEKAFNNRGYIKFVLGDLGGAMNDYNTAIEINPKDAEAFNNRGLEKVNLGDKQGAMQDFNKAIELNPQFVKVYYNRGTAKGSLGDMVGAIQDFNKAIELNPKYVQAFNNRGNAKATLGDKNGACSDWMKAGELGDKNAYEMMRKYCK